MHISPISPYRGNPQNLQRPDYRNKTAQPAFEGKVMQGVFTTLAALCISIGAHAQSAGKVASETANTASKKGVTVVTDTISAGKKAVLKIMDEGEYLEAKAAKSAQEAAADSTAASKAGEKAAQSEANANAARTQATADRTQATADRTQATADRTQATKSEAQATKSEAQATKSEAQATKSEAQATKSEAQATKSAQELADARKRSAALFDDD